jgi:hypothetical protein
MKGSTDLGAKPENQLRILITGNMKSKGVKLYFRAIGGVSLPGRGKAFRKFAAFALKRGSLRPFLLLPVLHSGIQFRAHFLRAIEVIIQTAIAIQKVDLTLVELDDGFQELATRSMPDRYFKFFMIN